MRAITSARLATFVLKFPRNVAGHSAAALFANAANCHAGVLRLDDHGDSGRVEFGFDQISDRLSHPLLYLGTTGDFVDHPSQFAKPGNTAIGDVGDMRDATKRQQVMFAHAAEGNVSHEDHLIEFFGEGHLQMPGRIQAKAGEHFLIHTGDAAGCILQSGAVWIFANGREDRTHCRFDGGQIELGGRSLIYGTGR